MGIPQDIIEKTKVFHYNDIKSIEALISQYPDKIACVVMEPAATEEPKDGFLNKVQEVCKKNGIVFILDEMITGFRWHMKGAQHTYGVTPDLCAFGKAMANGFSVSCVAGRREIMELGSIEKTGRERLFLLSTTHGAEMSGLGAFVATVNFMRRNGVVEHMWDYGRKLMSMMKYYADARGISNSFKIGGVACSPYYLTLDESGKNSMVLRTLFVQEMIRNGVLMPWISLCYRHREDELALTEIAFKKSIDVYYKALNEGPDKYVNAPFIKPVFRKYN